MTTTELIAIKIEFAQEDVEQASKELRRQMEGLASDMATALRDLDAGRTLNELGEAQRAREVNRLCAVLAERQRALKSLQALAKQVG